MQPSVCKEDCCTNYSVYTYTDKSLSMECQLQFISEESCKPTSDCTFIYQGKKRHANETLGTLFACRSFCFATSWRQSDLQCTMFYCMRREIFSDQFFGWIMVKGPDIKCIKNLGSLKSNGGPRPWFAPPKLRNENCKHNIIQQQQRVTNLHVVQFF